MKPSRRELVDVAGPRARSRLVNGPPPQVADGRAEAREATRVGGHARSQPRLRDHPRRRRRGASAQGAVFGLVARPPPRRALSRGRFSAGTDGSPRRPWRGRRRAAPCRALRRAADPSLRSGARTSTWPPRGHRAGRDDRRPPGRGAGRGRARTPTSSSSAAAGCTAQSTRLGVGARRSPGRLLGPRRPEPLMEPAHAPRPRAGRSRGAEDRSRARPDAAEAADGSRATARTGRGAPAAAVPAPRCSTSSSTRSCCCSSPRPRSRWRSATSSRAWRSWPCSS